MEKLKVKGNSVYMSSNLLEKNGDIMIAAMHNVPNKKETAERIVRTWNHHDLLIKELRGLLNASRGAAMFSGNEWSDDPQLVRVERLLTKLK